jgi:DNA-binding response OmpR family regulator
VIGARVLVVEDDRTIADEVRAELVAHGYEVSLASTGRGGLDLARSDRPDLVLLDLGLPDLDGVQLCRTLRAELPTVPIVIVTARDTDVDVVVGLDAGATDYVTKPFSTAVLLARVRAHLRGDATNGRDAELIVGSLRVDAAAHRAFVADVELDLRPKEFALLLALVESAGKVLTRDQLLRDVWDLHWDSSTKTLDIHVHALRRKLGDRPDGQQWITTVRTVGYRFELA